MMKQGVDTVSDDILRRIERLENRLNIAERDLAGLSSELHLIKEDLSNRIADVKQDLKHDLASTKTDIRERIDSLRIDLKEDMESISSTIGIVNTSVTQITEAIQNLYVTQSTASVKVNTNEKIIWAVISIAVTAGLYFLQAFLTRGG